MRISDWSSDVCSSDLVVILAATGLQFVKIDRADENIALLRSKFPEVGESFFIAYRLKTKAIVQPLGQFLLIAMDDFAVLIGKRTAHLCQIGRIQVEVREGIVIRDRKRTRLNSSH